MGPHDIVLIKYAGVENSLKFVRPSIRFDCTDGKYSVKKNTLNKNGAYVASLVPWLASTYQIFWLNQLIYIEAVA